MTLAVASRALYLRCEFKYGVWSGDTAPTQLYDPVNFTKLAIQSQTQKFEQLVSNMESSAGQVLASVAANDKTASRAAESDFMPPHLFGLLLGADITELAQTTSAVTNEVGGVNPAGEMSWQRYAVALLAFSVAGFVTLYGLLRVQAPEQLRTVQRRQRQALRQPCRRCRWWR